MPLDPRIPPYFQIAVNSFLAGRLQVQQFNFTPTGPLLVSEDVQSACDDFVTLLTSTLIPQLSHEVHFQSVDGALHTVDNIIEVSVPFSEVGGNINTALPGQDVAEIQWSLNRIGGARLVRGKTFISGCSIGDEEGGTLNDTLVDGLAAFAQGVIDFGPGIDPDSKFVIWSTRDSQWVPVVDFGIKSMFKTLRRRRTSS